MPLPTGHAEVTIDLTNIAGRSCVNVFGVKVVNPIDAVAVDQLSTLMAAAYKPVLNTVSRYNGLRVLNGDDGPGVEFSSTTGNGIGTRDEATLSPQVQALIKKTTGAAGRANRGRTFIPDVPESLVSNQGVLVSSGITLYQTLANAIFAALLSDTEWDGMEILHDSGAAPTLVTGYNVESKVATLRPRFPR